MVKAGAHAKYLQAQMGHSSIQVTLDKYGHLFPDANRGVLDASMPSSARMVPTRCPRMRPESAPLRELPANSLWN